MSWSPNQDSNTARSDGNSGLKQVSSAFEVLPLSITPNAVHEAGTGKVAGSSVAAYALPLVANVPVVFVTLLGAQGSGVRYLCRQLAAEG